MIDLHEVPVRRWYDGEEIADLYGYTVATKDAESDRLLADYRHDLVVIRAGEQLLRDLCTLHGEIRCRRPHPWAETRWLPSPLVPLDLSSTTPAEHFGSVPIPARYSCLPKVRGLLWRRWVERPDPLVESWHKSVTAVLTARVNDGTMTLPIPAWQRSA